MTTTRPPRLLAIDNRDSFTFMLVDRLRVAGAEVEVVRSDAVSVDEALALGRQGVMISPGPGRPEDAGISVALAGACIAKSVPLLGVCLGHQAMALACDGTVDTVPPVHGKTARVRHDGTGLFEGLETPLEMTRYHSIAVMDPGHGMVPNAWNEDSLVMGMRHEAGQAHGVQFHPESIASPAGDALLAAFVQRCGAATT